MKTKLLCPVFPLCLALFALHLLPGCRPAPLLQGEKLLTTPRFDKIGLLGTRLDPRIDTSGVYTMTITRCTECSNNLKIKRYICVRSCQPYISCNEEVSEGNNSGSTVIDSPAMQTFDAESTHFLRFVDEKRVIYGVVKNDHLPTDIDLTETKRNIFKRKKYARGYYAVNDHFLYLRLQNMRSRQVFDVRLRFDGPASDLLVLDRLTTYDAEDEHIHSASFERRYDLNTILSYEFTFERMPARKMLLQPLDRPCWQQPGSCATW